MTGTSGTLRELFEESRSGDRDGDPMATGGEKSALTEALRPVSIEQFTQDILGSHCLVLRADEAARDRFATLTNWAHLSRIVAEDRTGDRFKVVADGRSIPDHAYLLGSVSRRGTRPAVDPSGLRRELLAGASIVVEALDELSDDLGAFCAALEEAVLENVQANGYGSFSGRLALPPHKDPHDVLILQVDGEKTWSIGAVPNASRARNGAITAEPFHVSPRRPPAAERLWTFRLHRGDVLYLPTGTWHVAIAERQPSLHLTVGWQRRSVGHYLKDLLGHAENEGWLSSPLPRFADSQTLSRSHEWIRGRLDELVTRHDLPSFLRSARMPGLRRPRVRFPDIALPADRDEQADGA